MAANNITTIGAEAPTAAPGVAVDSTKAPQIRWHYTTGQKYILILRDGLIKPATAGVPPGERPIVWFSTNQEWEPTANKMAYSSGNLFTLTMDQTRELGGGLVRFGAAPETAPHDWHALRDLSRMSGRMAQALYRSAIKQGARRPARTWRCCRKGRRARSGKSTSGRKTSFLTFVRTEF